MLHCNRERERYYNRDRKKERERLQQINKRYYVQLSDMVEK